MTLIDPIGDMITRIRNAQMRLLGTVNIPNSKFRAKILEVLKHEGYISDFKLVTNEIHLIRHNQGNYYLQLNHILALDLYL